MHSSTLAYTVVWSRDLTLANASRGCKKKKKKRELKNAHFRIRKIHIRTRESPNLTWIFARVSRSSSPKEKSRDLVLCPRTSVYTFSAHVYFYYTINERLSGEITRASIRDRKALVRLRFLASVSAACGNEFASLLKSRINHRINLASWTRRQSAAAVKQFSAPFGSRIIYGRRGKTAK